MTLSLPLWLHDVLCRREDRVVTTLVALDGSETVVRARELAARAGAVAAAVSRLGLQGRALIGIAHKTGPWLHAAWVGVIWAGHVPTMIAPPSPRMEPRKFAAGFTGIIEHLAVEAIVLDGATHAALGELLPPAIPVLSTDTLRPASDPPPPPRDVPDDAEVALQHTSGTTGAQKAIGFTSRQIAAHTTAFLDRLGVGESDVIVSWLPLYHDMGFIACFVTPLLCGIPLVELSPFDWVQRPALLFDAIGRHGGTLCWLPNFAFKVLSEERLLAAAAGAGITWQLGGVRAFISCSEPVMADAITRFAARLGPHGVRRDQIIASYAMAETLFGVTQNEIGRPLVVHADRQALERDARLAAAAPGSTQSLELVSSGRAFPTVIIEIRDSDGKVVPDGTIGHINVASSHLFTGYRGRPDLTAAVMDKAGYYATGDLGFLLEGELFVTGRSKDLLIIRGRNYYPHDIEELVGQVRGVNPGRIAAFGVYDAQAGTEKLIVMLELSEDAAASPGQIALAVRTHIAQSLDCAIADLRIVPPKTLVKSTSGKVARSENRARYLSSLQGG